MKENDRTAQNTVKTDAYIEHFRVLVPFGRRSKVRVLAAKLKINEENVY